MTAKELIEYLQTCPQDAEVLTNDNESGYIEISKEGIIILNDVVIEETIKQNGRWKIVNKTIRQAIIL